MLFFARAEQASNFRLSVTPLSLQVLAPQTGTTWPLGQVQTIQWSSNSNTVPGIKVELQRTSSSTWELLGNNLSASGQLQVTPSGAATSSAKIKVSVVDHPQYYATSGNFNIGAVSSSGGSITRSGSVSKSKTVTTPKAAVPVSLPAVPTIPVSNNKAVVSKTPQTVVAPKVVAPTKPTVPTVTPKSTVLPPSQTTTPKISPVKKIVDYIKVIPQKIKTILGNKLKSVKTLITRKLPTRKFS